VIGGGDWAADRLVPDCVRAITRGEEIVLRNPLSVRPWQHVLEPLYGYLLLVENIFSNSSEPYSHWNFGPKPNEFHTVEWMVNKLLGKWGEEYHYQVNAQNDWPESHLLQLDSTKAHLELNWKSIWNASKSIDKVVDWYQLYLTREDMTKYTIQQIEEYQRDGEVLTSGY
jgi:CDP-glucose 4,6-dehydratase